MPVEPYYIHIRIKQIYRNRIIYFNCEMPIVLIFFLQNHTSSPKSYMKEFANLPLRIINLWMDRGKTAKIMLLCSIQLDGATLLFMSPGAPT